MPGIGMRTVKTALAVFLILLVYRLPGMDSPFYAAIAAIIAMQSSVKESFTAGKDRMLGTVTGALAGLILALLHPGHPVLIGVGIIAVIYVCDKLGWNKSISIAGIVFLAIMLNMEGRNPVQYSLFRILDTFIGITTAVLVNAYIAPPRHYDVLASRFDWFTREVVYSLQKRWCEAASLDLKELEAGYEKLRSDVAVFLSETRFKKSDVDRIEEVRIKLQLCSDLYQHLKMIASMEGPYYLDIEHRNTAKDILNCDLPENLEPTNELHAVMNYHGGIILESLKQFTAPMDKC